MSPAPRSMARRLATYITDRGAIAAHLSRDFGRQFTSKDVKEMLLPSAIASTPRDARTVGEPISFSPPLQTTYAGNDPLAIATNAYLARNEGKIREALGHAST